MTTLVANAHAGWFDQVPTRSGDYCEDEAVDYLHRHFGESIKIKGVKKIGGGGMPWAYYAETDICRGTFAFHFNMDHSIGCKEAQFGWRSRVLDNVYGLDECQSVLFGDN